MKKTKKKNKYDIQYAVKGTFLDVLKASASHANKKVKKKLRKKAK